MAAASIASSDSYQELTETPTFVERENLMVEAPVKRSGFTPRPVERLASRKLPRSNTNIECAHFLRSSTRDNTHGHKPMEFILWQEAGKHNPPFPSRPDKQYNSNVWRNFRKSYGFHTNTDGQKVSEMIASMYPLNVPPPSRVGDCTYAKFLRETPIIKGERKRQVAINRTAKDIEEFRRLRLRADMRNPPLDESGKIIPPMNFKRYAHRFIPPAELAEQQALPPPPPGETRIDIFGQEVPKLKSAGPHLWKMTYKLNHPQYMGVKEEMQRRRAIPTEQLPYVTLGKAY